MTEIERHQRIKEIFDSAVLLDKTARAEYLASACADDGELRREAESLLDSFEESEDFIEKPIGDLKEALVSDQRIGQKISNYRIIKKIGEGGMGLVYLAAREDDFRQRVALKLVRGLDTEDILRRFRNERQILAGLQHPNICRLLDGGMTDDGLPFFVMEYVEGLPLLDHCDERRLSKDQRLDLFKMICAAVQHAHQNLVIHRDLKPSNIFVTTNGEVKLLDFGIAKFLNPELSAEQTQTQFRVMTPEYASPEQIIGARITTASDVYSLGVVLFELLTGEMPFKLAGKNLAEVIRVVTEVEPNLPSKIASGQGFAERTRFPLRNPQSLNGDLDNIVLMALRKEPARRYRSVEQFAGDIQRHLKGLPVSARPNTFSYRAEKFIKRNKAACAAGALLLISLLGGLAFSLRQANAAFAAQTRAETETTKSQRIARFMEKVLNYANPAWYAEGRERKGEAKLIEVVNGLSEKIAIEFPGDLDIQAELHHKFAEIYQAKLNRNKSLFHAERALHLRRLVFGEKHAEVAKDLYYLSAAKWLEYNFVESVKLGDQAIDMFRAVAPDNPNLPYLLEDTGNIYLESYADYYKAESYYAEALEIFQKKTATFTTIPRAF
jgi:serine/threonine protein kinase